MTDTLEDRIAELEAENAQTRSSMQPVPIEPAILDLVKDVRISAETSDIDYERYVLSKAADRIEALEAENERLRGKYEDALMWMDNHDPDLVEKAIERFGLPDPHASLKGGEQ